MTRVSVWAAEADCNGRELGRKLSEAIVTHYRYRETLCTVDDEADNADRARAHRNVAAKKEPRKVNLIGFRSDEVGEDRVD